MNVAVTSTDSYIAHAHGRDKVSELVGCRLKSLLATKGQVVLTHPRNCKMAPGPINTIHSVILLSYGIWLNWHSKTQVRACDGMIVMNFVHQNDIMLFIVHVLQFPPLFVKSYKSTDMDMNIAKLQH